MAIVNKPNTFSSNTTISSPEVNSNFDTLYNEFNGSISAANLADDAVTAAKLADNAVVTASIADANVTNAKLASQAWQSWTPTWTNLTVGNGTVDAKYTQVGKTVVFRIAFLLGTTSSVGSNPTFSLPATVSSAYTSLSGYVLGGLYLEDAGVTGYQGTIQTLTSGTAQMTVGNATGTYLQNSGISSAVPFSWGTNDLLRGQGFYEAA